VSDSRPVETVLDETGRSVIAWRYPASPESVLQVLFAPVGDDNGRSEAHWLRLVNGDLVLAVAPRGGTYEAVEVDAAVPDDAETVDDHLGEQRFEYRHGVSYLRDGKGASVGFYRMPENDQLLVSINTEDCEFDNDGDGNPIMQVTLNDATLYDNEREKPASLPQREYGPTGPYLLRCTFVPQWVPKPEPGFGLERIETMDLRMLGRTWPDATWEGEYDEAPSETRSHETDQLRDHPNAPAWVKDWDGPFEVEFQVRFTVVGTYEGMGGEAARYTEAFWADDANHAAEQARDSARSAGETLNVSAVLYGEAQVAA
jgi:hypothetical protein